MVEPDPLRRASALWLCAAATLYLGFGYTEMMGSDLWWHLAAGREILEHRTPWLRDQWSYTKTGVPWMNHEWLADVIYALWARAFGVASLVYWKWLLLLATFLGLQELLYREVGDRGAAVLATLAALLLAAPFLDLRPHLYTLLGTVVLLLLQFRRTAPRWQLFLLFFLWVNLHGGFVFGLLLLMILVFPWREPSIPGLKRALSTLVVAILASLLNPDGYRVFLLPLVYAFSDSPYRTLGEWLSPFLAGGIRSPAYGYALLIGGALTLACFLPALRKRTGVPWETIVFCLLTAAMSATSRRFIPLFGISLALLLAPFLALVMRLQPLQKLSPVLALAALAVGLWRMAPLPLRAEPAFHYLAAEYAFPHDLLDFAEVNELSGRVFAYYNWGGFIHWRTDGQFKVFIDGRANTLFDDETYLRYRRVLRGDREAVSLVMESDADYFLWPRTPAAPTAVLRGLWQTRAWKLLYQDARGVLLARNEVPLPSRLLAPSAASPHRSLTAAAAALDRNDLQGAIAASAAARETLPWQRDACHIQVQSSRRLGQADEADNVLEDCLGYFPTRYLR